MSWNEEYRALFPVTGKCVYMDCAYDCGGSEIGLKAAQKFFSDWAQSAAENERGGPGRGVFFRYLDEGREYINTLIGGTGASQIAYTRNANEGINAILQGFDFKTGDNIITDDIEHQSVIMPCLNVKHTKGVEVRVLAEREDRRILVDDLIALADENTRMFVVSHVQSVTGYCLDLEKLGAFCRSHGIFLVVDAIQTLGQKPFYAEKWGVDALSAGSYKGLGGVESSGFVYVKKELLSHIWPVYTAAGFIMSVDRSDGEPKLVCSDSTSARKLENSSLDNLGGYIIHDSVQKILEIGVDEIWAHINRLYHRLYDGFRVLGYDILSAENDDEHAAPFVLKAEDSGLFDYMRSRNIVLTYAHDLIRISIGPFTNDEDIDAVLAAAAEYRNK